MKISDLVDMKGKYSAKDVGDVEIEVDVDLLWEEVYKFCGLQGIRLSRGQIKMISNNISTSLKEWLRAK
jgi:hypothetical protein